MFLHVITWYTVREVFLSLTLDFIHKGGNPDVMHQFCWPYITTGHNPRPRYNLANKWLMSQTT